MVGSFYTVTVEGDVEEKLLQMRAMLMPSRLAQFLSEEGHAVMRRRIDNRFDTEGDDASGIWAALKYPTQQTRRALGLGDQHPINVRTGELKRWILTDEPDVIMVGSGAQYTFPGGTPVDPKTAEKFSTAQQGSTNPATVPRPVLAMSQVDTDLMVAALGLWFNAQMAGAAIP